MDSGQSTAQAAIREAHLRDYWKVVWQGRWTILATFVVVVGATGVWTWLQPPIYQSMAIIEVQPQARRLLAGGDVSGMGAAGLGWLAEEKYHNTQVEIIKSRDVSRRVVRVLGLESHPMFAEVPDVVDAFRSMIMVNPRRDTGLLQISIAGAEPREITQWTNAVAHAYVARNFEKAKGNNEQAVATIREQMDALSRDLRAAEELRIGALRDADSQIFNSETQEDILKQKLQAYNAELTGVNIELSQLDSTLRRVRQMQAAGADLMSIHEVAENETLQDLFGQKVSLERDLEEAKVDLRAGHPEYEKRLSAVQGVERKIGDQITLFVGSLQNRHSLLSKKQRYLNEQIRLAEEFSLEVARATSEYEITKTDAESKKQVLDLIARTMQEVQLNAELMNNNVSVLDEATVPRFPIKPRKKVNLAIGAMFALFLGLGAVFFLDYLDNTIRTPEDVEKFLGLSVVGVVPKMAEQGLSQRAIKEAYQSLRTSIIFSSKNRERKVILTTSSGPREGKSSTVANLGRTLAAAGDRVVVIDCDLRRPTQHVHFKLDREPGLTNYLAGRAEDLDWERYAKPVNPTTLQLLTSGPLPPSPPDLLGNTRFSDMLEAMRERYDWILIDSPPAATLADASLLASLADMLVLVVQHNTTDRDHVVKTVQTLRSANASIAGVVLNNVDLDRAYHKDYYYAGYYYEEDGEKGKGARRRTVERTRQVG